MDFFPINLSSKTILDVWIDYQGARNLTVGRIKDGQTVYLSIVGCKTLSWLEDCVSNFMMNDTATKITLPLSEKEELKVDKSKDIPLTLYQTAPEGHHNQKSELNITISEWLLLLDWIACLTDYLQQGVL